MTQLQTLNVEGEELLARADELEAPIASWPVENPAPPCNFAMTKAAAQQLSLSAGNMRLYLGVSQREWKRLAESLRNAAKAYADVDQAAAEAINNETAVSPASRGPAAEGVAEAGLDDTPVGAMAAAPDVADVKQRLLDGETGDQGAAMLRFADEWEAYARTLLEARYRFRPFYQWQGDASDLVEQNFDQQRGWLDQMAALCLTMAKQARGLASTQRWAQKEHIWYTDHTVSYSELVQIERIYSQQALTRGLIMQVHAHMLAKSDEVLAEYRKRADLPLAPVSPPKPPTAYRIDPPPKPGPGPLDPGPGNGGIGPGTPGEVLPPDDASFPDPTGVPALPSAGLPSIPNNAAMNNAGSDVANGLPPGGPALKPASFGGGGAGGGVPRVPLVPPAEAGSAAKPATGLEAGLGRAMPGTGGALGRGGAGMAPVGGPAGQGQPSGKGKRAQQEEESVYTEDRPWTQGIIGRRRPKDAPPDGEDAK
ncbi:secretion protein EspB [Mycobacterium simiae]|uniref:Secretion protein EspB n=1 Tax=Mycobacterium simiae TaxID=1784 RepID=A0A5B1BVH8_MYCSI|nr:secretion protein EspB [Mycobacterium simiae]KAA1251745.1 secretion protein EspB [Mycobacterium simiae]